MIILLAFVGATEATAYQPGPVQELEQALAQLPACEQWKDMPPPLDDDQEPPPMPKRIAPPPAPARAPSRQNSRSAPRWRRGRWKAKA